MVFINDPASPNGLPVVPLWINGAAQKIDKQALFPVINSVKNEPIHYAVSATPADAVLAADSAASAFASWSKTAPNHRRGILLKAADIIERRAKELCEWQIAETSCTEAWANFNVTKNPDYVREIAAATSELRGTVPQLATAPNGNEEGGLAIVVREPIGTILIIPPWNAATVLPVRAITMALAAGCTIVLKSSELCPRTHSTLVEVFEEAGVPKGVINVIQARREDAAPVVEALVSHKAIRKIDFIGSPAVGRKIGEVCARYLKPMLMELGGKSPAIVLEDANLEAAAALCANGAMLHHGQICFSTERIIVHKSVYEKFAELLVTEVSKITSAGDAVTEQSAVHAYEVLLDAQQKGAKFLVGGPEYISKTSLKPTIVTNVNSDAKIWDEETFGPSTTVYIAEDDEDAINKANGTSSGLSAAVHSTNWEHAYNVAKRLEYGQVNINSMTIGDSVGFPICGVKGSGWGQSNSIWGIHSERSWEQIGRTIDVLQGVAVQGTRVDVQLDKN